MKKIASMVLGLGLASACRNPHVNGTTLAPDPPCTRNWTAVVTNNTSRIYDLYVGNRVIGTADPRTTTRTIIDPRFGQVTPTLIQSATTRDQKGPYIASNAMRMVCE
jgi:hypothetical protein